MRHIKRKLRRLRHHWPLAARTRGFLVLGCGVIACLMVVSLSCTAAETDSVLRIMTWNIRYDNPDDGIHTWALRKEKLSAFIRSQGVDLLCIQEGLESQVAFLKESHPGFDVRGVGRDDGKAKGEYSAIYFNKSRFGCLAAGTFWLAPTPLVPSRGWDAALPRIVTWVRLHDSLTATDFTVFNTHFDHMGVVARDSSAALLRRKIAEIAGTSPFLLAGDFNSVDTDTPFRMLTSRNSTLPALYDALTRSISPPGGPAFTFTGFNVKDPESGERIDYVFVSDGVRVLSHSTHAARRTEGYLSDHLPVAVDVSFR